ncbi:hypothetical protein IHC39_001571 [Enterococcus faecalis]|uniref:hypothetical protein n=1 Tax=Enterococcus faecalis TaxID=1351 RepID=UPI00032D7168|nr:hypothetical protein [Enterococcus faecalis]EGO2587017.1 hypothetical protein [Enterococcus faecalis]EGO5850093.1 hypothetical protein [Enterococcus faecalis]EIA1377392.1 hypothetical protein [Enterococcus faecalis]EJI7260619.1 hypothetical protein [Enterococcus faecalis]EOJ58617.1 hypothetical protein WMI_00166 [Enterococcus faecalis EnGen0363]
MKPSKTTAKLLKGHNISFSKQIVLDLIPNGNKSYALLAPRHTEDTPSLRYFVLSKGYGDNEYFTSIDELVYTCVEEKVISSHHGKTLITKYLKDKNNIAFYLDKNLAEALNEMQIDFSRYFILELLKPASAIVPTKLWNAYLAPYDTNDYFVRVQRSDHSRIDTLDRMLEIALWYESITKKQAKQITDTYNKAMEELTNE